MIKEVQRGGNEVNNNDKDVVAYNKLAHKARLVVIIQILGNVKEREKEMRSENGGAAKQQNISNADAKFCKKAHFDLPRPNILRLLHSHNLFRLHYRSFDLLICKIRRQQLSGCCFVSFGQKVGCSLMEGEHDIAYANINDEEQQL